MKYLYVMVIVSIIMASCGGPKSAATQEESHLTVTSEGHEGHDHDHDKEHAHEHNKDCDHDHDKDKNQEENHAHEHDKDCDHDHDKEHDHSNEKEHNHDHDKGQEENPDEIVFPPSQAEKTDFEVQRATAAVFNEVIRTGGRILPAQGDEVTLVASTSGVVSFASKRLVEGANVGRGQQLFYISSRNVASGDIVAKNKAVYEKAKYDYERAERLVGDNIVSQKEFAEIKLAYQEARAAYQAFEGASTTQGVAVSSQISGYITTLTVKSGDYVEIGQILGSVAQNRNLVLRAELSQRYLSQLRSIQSANFTLPYSNSTYRLSELGGRMLSFSRTTLEGTTLVPITFEFANNGAVIPGSYVDVYLLGVAKENVIALPITAVTEQQGLYYVYAQLDAECYERREVKLGGSNGLEIEILSGVADGDRIVTRGAVNVKMAASSGAIPHGHEH